MSIAQSNTRIFIDPNSGKDQCLLIDFMPGFAVLLQGEKIVSVNQNVKDVLCNLEICEFGKFEPAVLFDQEDWFLLKNAIKQTNKSKECSTLELPVYIKGTQKWMRFLVHLYREAKLEENLILVQAIDISNLISIKKDLKKLIYSDPLTDCYNRTFFEIELKRLEGSRLYPISFLYIDLNNLKEVNDSQGHLHGDELLIGLAKVLLKTFRKEDIVARVGGDEFIIMLPETDEKTVQSSITRLKKNINSFNENETKIHIDIAVGYSTAERGESLSEAIHRADILMIMNKKETKKD